MTELPENIIIEILTRLPVKSLMRFKCTNKRWYHLLSHPQFAKLHYQRGSKDTANTITTPKKLLKTSPLQSIDYESFDLFGHHSALVDLDIPILPSSSNKTDLRIVGSCDGLICLIYNESFILWNPTTTESRYLPKPTIAPNGKGGVFYGFGYDSITDDYKILLGINFTKEDGIGDSMAEVFTLRANSWRRILDKFPHKISNIDHPSSFVNDSIHWLVKYKLNRQKVYSIVSFNVSEEKFCETLPLPDNIQGSSFKGLGVHEECLMVHHGYCWWGVYSEGLVMKEYGVKASWSKVFKISCDELSGCMNWLGPLVWTRNGNIVFDVDAGGLIIYNEKEHTCKSIPIKTTDQRLDAVVYVESLVSPFRDSGRLEMPW